MKSLFAVASVIAISLQASAQGLIGFSNTGLVDAQLGLYNAPVSLPDGSLANSRFIAGLFLVQPNQLTLLGTSPFRNGPAAGFFIPDGFQVPGFPPVSRATFRARVWETAAGSYEAAVAAGLLHGEFPTRNPENNFFSEPLGHPISGGDIPRTHGIFAFTLVPEPSPLALFCAAAVLLSLLRKRRGLPISEQARRIR